MKNDVLVLVLDVSIQEVFLVRFELAVLVRALVQHIVIVLHQMFQQFWAHDEFLRALETLVRDIFVVITGVRVESFEAINNLCAVYAHNHSIGLFKFPYVVWQMTVQFFLIVRVEGAENALKLYRILVFSQVVAMHVLVQKKFLLRWKLFSTHLAFPHRFTMRTAFVAF
jgi:hypothetical protein